MASPPTPPFLSTYPGSYAAYAPQSSFVGTPMTFIASASASAPPAIPLQTYSTFPNYVPQQRRQQQPSSMVFASARAASYSYVGSTPSHTLPTYTTTSTAFAPANAAVGTRPPTFTSWPPGAPAYSSIRIASGPQFTSTPLPASYRPYTGISSPTYYSVSGPTQTTAAAFMARNVSIPTSYSPVAASPFVTTYTSLPSAVPTPSPTTFSAVNTTLPSGFAQSFSSTLPAAVFVSEALKPQEPLPSCPAPVPVELLPRPTSASKLDFVQQSEYVDGSSGTKAGARYVHKFTGFTLDVLNFQSVPQAMLWVNTAPCSDKGESHTLEHLVLGKGSKGAALCDLESTLLASSSAFTEQTTTVYHWSCVSGFDSFIALFRTRLDALLDPDFTDDEAEREVCHFGVTRDSTAEGGSVLHPEEKGTIYNEMLTYADQPSAALHDTLKQELFGKNHPLSFISGGDPAAIRTVTRDDLRKCHERWYSTRNMGMVLSLSNKIDVDAALVEVSRVLNELGNPLPVNAELPVGAEHAWNLPKIQMAAERSVKIAHFPHTNPSEPSSVLFGWLTDVNQKFDLAESYLLSTFCLSLASGSTSTLHFLSVEDGEERKFRSGAASVSGWVDDHVAGCPCYISYANVETASVSAQKVDELRSFVLQTISRLCGNPVAGCDEDANKKLVSQFISGALRHVRLDRKNWRAWRETPPAFGERGTYDCIVNHLNTLNYFSKRSPNDDGKRDLLCETVVNNLERKLEQLASDHQAATSFWADCVQRWGLLETPVAVAATPSPDLRKQLDKSKEERLSTFVSKMKAKFGTTDDQKALEAYQKEYDTITAKIESHIAAESAKATKASFPAAPPLTLDDDIDVSIHAINPKDEAAAVQCNQLCTAEGSTLRALPTLPASLVVSRFPGRSAVDLSVSFDVRVPTGQALLPYLALLPTLINKAGVILEDGTKLKLKAMQEKLSSELISVSCGLQSHPERNLVYLKFSAKASDFTEMATNAGAWLRRLSARPLWELDNLPALKQAVHQKLHGIIDLLKSSDEYWVENPFYGVMFQCYPHYVATNCHFTVMHFCYRMGWLLKEWTNSNTAEKDRLIGVVRALVKAFDKQLEPSEDGVVEPKQIEKGLELLKAAADLASPVSANSAGSAPEDLKDFVALLSGCDQTTRSLVIDLVKDVHQNLSTTGITVVGDAGAVKTECHYLFNRLLQDLFVSPADVLQRFRALLRAIVDPKNILHASVIMGADGPLPEGVSPLKNANTKETYCVELIRDLVFGPNAGDSLAPIDKVAVSWVAQRRDVVDAYPVVTRNLTKRTNGNQSLEVPWKAPQGVALINEDMPQGMLATANRCMAISDEPSQDLIATYLAAQVFTGGGKDSLFIKAWHAGLAYCSGLSCGEMSGMTRYYADHCPSLTRTFEFVTKTLWDDLIKLQQLRLQDPKAFRAKWAEQLDYGVAEGFSNTRANLAYDSRGASLTADLICGKYPCLVARFRKALLQVYQASREVLRSGDAEKSPLADPDLAAQLFDRVLPKSADRKDDLNTPVPASYNASRLSFPAVAKAPLFFAIGRHQLLAEYETHLKEAHRKIDHYSVVDDRGKTSIHQVIAARRRFPSELVRICRSDFWIREEPQLLVLP